MSLSPHDPAENPPAPKPGLRAARERQGLTQEQAAALVNAPLSSYRRWDRGANPRDPEMAQALAEALATPIEVIWPPEENAHVDLALRALREQRARAAAEARLAQPPTDPDLWDTASPAVRPVAAREPDAVPSVAGPATSAPGPVAMVPDPRDIVRTLDGLDDPAASLAPRGPRQRRFVVSGVAALVAVLAGGTALATTASDNGPSTIPAAVTTGPTPTQRERAAQQAALARARDRRDFDAAIMIATQLGDTNAAAELRKAAGELLARRARAAADRGDLDLATSRLTRARERYGDAPSLTRVQRRITAVKSARKARAARRRVAARQRAARAASVAARQRTTAPAVSAPASTPSTSAAPSPPSSRSVTPSASPAPAPSPAPRPAGGSSGSGRSSGGSAEDEFGYLGG